MDPERALDIAVAGVLPTCCNLAKQDVPEVEAVIRIVRSRLDAYWQKMLDQGIDELMASLEEIPDTLGMPDVDPLARAGEDRDRVLEDLLLALLLSLEGRLLSDPIPSRLRLINEGGKRLLRGGAASQSLPLDFGMPGVVQLPSLAQEDVLLATRGRYLRNKEEVKALIEGYLTNRAVRRPRGILDPSGAPPGFEEELGELLGRGGASSVPLVTDSWAYRWFNLGTASAAIQGGQEALVAVNNPPGGPDNKTTPFCQWVHGKVISVRKVERQFDEYADAIRAGDPEAQIRSWPFLSPAAAKDSKSFRPFFASVGLPPYHHSCRTRVSTRIVTL